MAKHALLSPSGAGRWMTCTPSVVFEQQFEEKSSSYADEGTLAHSLSEIIILHKSGQMKDAQYNHDLEKIQRDELYSQSMMDHCEEYAMFVLELYYEQLDKYHVGQLETEVKIDVSDYVPEGFGTSDVNIVSDGLLTVIDLKYGKGVPVYAEENKQLMIYALGSYLKHSFWYDIKEIKMVIYQPRIQNFSDWTIPVKHLLDWAAYELRPKALQAYDGVGEYVAGPHCRFCKAKIECKAHMKWQVELAKFDFHDPDRLEDKDIEWILTRYDVFVNWIKSIEEYALQRALKGKKWEGFKLVEGRSNRKFTDQDQVAQTLEKNGYDDEIIYKKEVNSISKLEELLGKKVVATILEKLIVKPPGAPTLVDDKDKRPALNSSSKAQDDFKNVDTDNL